MLSGYAPMPTLPTADLAKAKAFYEGLGFTVGEHAFPGAVTFAAGDGRFLVYESTFAGTNQATAMGFEVPAAEFDAVLGALRSNGIAFDTFEAEGMVWDGDVMIAEGMKNVWFRDPDGNIVSVGSRD